MANRQADALFDGERSLLGCEARIRLPEAFSDCIDAAGDGLRTITLADGRRLHVRCHRMGDTYGSKGTVLVVSPIDGG
jgi:hypothetical protein